MHFYGRPHGEGSEHSSINKEVFARIFIALLAIGLVFLVVFIFNEIS